MLSLKLGVSSLAALNKGVGLGPTVASFIAGSHSGTLIVALTGVPAGATPSVSPSDGKVIVSGDEANGWLLVVGLNASSAGTINYTVSAGALSSVIAITAVAAATQPNTGYYFASARHRTPTSSSLTLPTVTAGEEYNFSVSEFYSPAYITNTYKLGFAGCFTTTASPIGEYPAPNAINVRGVHLQAFISGSWVDVAAAVGGQTAFDVPVGAGVWTDDIVFGQNVPANTRMQVRISFYVPAGQSQNVSIIPSQQGVLTSPFRTVASVEWQVKGAANFDSLLTASAKPSGTDGRVSGGIFAPACIVAKPVSALDRPVFWHNGDSKTFGKNENEGYLATKYLSSGFAARMFDDDATSRRMPAYIMSVPGMGPDTLYPANKQPYKLGLLRMLPNRPYTHMTTDHYNNGGMVSDADNAVTRAFFKCYFAMLLQESAYWGNAPAPLYQFRPIPRAGSSDWATTLAGQNPGTNALTNLVGGRWLFDADLVAGDIYTELTDIIPTNDDYAYDQSTNRDKVKLAATTYALATDYTSGANTISLTTAPPIDTILVLNAASSSGARAVRGVSGGGPYTVTLTQGVTVSGLTSGTALKTSYVGDSVGLHPGPGGHVLISQPAIAWKQATFG